MSNSAVFVIGPAGAGKSTLCSSLIEHGIAIGRAMHLINLDPAAEYFPSPPSKDIKELISVEEVMEELGLGPNGALIYSMEYLLDNSDWLELDLDLYEEEFLVVDCPGQIELYTHTQLIKQIIELFQRHGYAVCAVYLLESNFLQDISKYFAGVLNAMSAMIGLEVPHLNILSKMDLFDRQKAGLLPHAAKKSSEQANEELDRYLEVDPTLLAEWIQKEPRPRFRKLNEAIVQLITEYSMVRFLPFNLEDESSIADILSHIDHAIQYGEAIEPKEPNTKEYGGGDGDNDTSPC